MFVDTTLVHDSLTLDEIKELFFTDEEVRQTERERENVSGPTRNHPNTVGAGRREPTRKIQTFCCPNDTVSNLPCLLGYFRVTATPDCAVLLHGLYFLFPQDELIIMQYGIVSAQRNLFEELAVARSAIDFSEDDEDEELTEKNYIYGDDVLNCDYEFLTRTVEPNIDFPVIKRGQIEVESETDEPTPRLLLESDSESESDDDSLVRQSAHW